MITNQRTHVSPVLKIAGRRLKISKLTEYGFQFPDELGDQNTKGNVLNGRIGHDNTGLEIPVRFVVRRTSDGVAYGGFKDQTLAEKKELANFIESVENPAGTDALSSMTYDELAEGKVSSAKEPAKNPGENEDPAKSNTFKTLVAFLMAMAMLAILVAVIASVRMRYSVKIVNAVMVGNCLPISAPIEGQVAEVLVSQGQEVSEGDVLLLLQNQRMEIEHAKNGSALEAARRRVAAIQRMAIDHEQKIKLAKQRAQVKISVAEANLRKAQSELSAATSKVNRLEPLRFRRNIASNDFDEIVSVQAAALAECDAQKLQIKSLKNSIEAMDQGVLFLGDRIDNRPSELRAELEIAQAKVEQLTSDLATSEKGCQRIEITAPSDGSIYAIYHRPGEFMKLGQEALAMSLHDGGWATGHVPADQATKIKPGQIVDLKVPSLNMNLQGRVAAVGHRAVYGKGGYLNDFRSPMPNDVPIKVEIDDLAGEIPSGLRLNMTVQLESSWGWISEINLMDGINWLRGSSEDVSSEDVAQLN